MWVLFAGAVLVLSGWAMELRAENRELRARRDELLKERAALLIEVAKEKDARMWAERAPEREGARADAERRAQEAKSVRDDLESARASGTLITLKG